MTPPPCVVSSIATSVPSLNVVEGQTSPVTATVVATGCNTAPAITWESANPAIATVSASGLVAGVAAGGPVTITSRAGQASAAVAVTVVARTITTLTLVQPPTQGAVGTPLPLRVEAKDQLGNAIPAEVTWTVANGRVAVTAPGSVWTPCAAEGASCAVTGSRIVRYGADSSYRYLVASAPVACGAAAFGDDPLPNVAKACASAELLKASTATSLFPVGVGTTSVRARTANGVEASTTVTITGGRVVRWATRCPSCSSGAANFSAGTGFGVWPIALDSSGNTLLVPAQGSTSAPSIAGVQTFIPGQQFTVLGVAPGSATLTFAPSGGFTGPSATLPVTVTPVPTIGTALAADTSYALFVFALNRVGVRALLDSALGRFTVFAFDNAAMRSGGLTQAYLNTVALASLDSLMRFYIGIERLTGSDIPSDFPNRPLATLAPSGSARPSGTLTHVARNGGIAYLDGVPISALDVMATPNGVVHRGSRLVTWPRGDLRNTCGIVGDKLFCALIARGDAGEPPGITRVDSLLRSTSSDLTLLIPDDRAVKAALNVINGSPLAPGTEEAYIQNTLPIATARSIVLYHILPKRAFIVNFPLVTTVIPTLLGGAQGIRVDPALPFPRLLGLGNGGNFANIRFAEIFNTNNGTFHVIDRVLLPQ